MSECCFGIIKSDKLSLYIGHYSYIKDILNGVEMPIEGVVELSSKTVERSDTSWFPCVIIDFKNKIMFNSPLNGFNDFKQYLQESWTFKEVM
mgnify:CR=1 FL=1